MIKGQNMRTDSGLEDEVALVREGRPSPLDRSKGNDHLLCVPGYQALSEAERYSKHLSASSGQN